MTRSLLLPVVFALPAPAQQHERMDATVFVQAHCVECHGGDATKGQLDLTKPPAEPVAALSRWSRLRERVKAGEMPPADADQPPPALRAGFVAAIDALLAEAVPKLPPDPGRVTVRRLSRTQWGNCVRDLFGVDVSTSAFPADDLGYGFDTIGDALTFSTLHLEKYLAAANEVAAAVFHGEDPRHPPLRRFEAEAMPVEVGTNFDQSGDSANLWSNATLGQDVELPRDGVYRLRVFAKGDQAGDEPVKMSLRRGEQELALFEVPERRMLPFEVRLPLPRGAHHLAIVYVNDYWEPKHEDPARRDRNLYVDALEIEGPLDELTVPAAQQWLQAAMPASGDDAAKLRAIVRPLLSRVWRREPNDGEVARVADAGTTMLRAGRPLHVAQRLVLQAALASPHFLFRGEPVRGDGDPGRVVPLSGSALASRLSFFLWASTPDEELLAAARSGRLASAAGVAEQIDRHLADARAASLATDFAAQWLELRNLADRTPDPARFPGFDDTLRDSMRRETELLFLCVLREQRDVRDLLRADFTHVDATLAAFYGLPPVPAAAGFVRVELPAPMRERGGVLGHGSVLAVTSNPTRTSPVKRGKWILENLLGQAPPPPPPGNDSLANEAAIDSSRTFREQLAQHRARAACAICHVRMDALGFALERYDAVGRFRASDAGGPIDCSGQLPDGSRLDGLSDLKRVVAADPAFVRTIAHKLFVYAVGRDLRPADRLRLDVGVARVLGQPAVTLRDLVLLIARDEAFTSRVADG